jgi:hypothetical protein
MTGVALAAGRRWSGVEAGCSGVNPGGNVDTSGSDAGKSGAGER